MKKIAAILLSFTLIIAAFALSGAENTKVEGLEEHLNALFMTKHFTQEQLDEIIKPFVVTEERIKSLITPTEEFPLEAIYYLLRYFGTKGTTSSTLEEKAQDYLEKGRPDLDKGIKVTLLNTSNYAHQYAASNSFAYLLSEKEYWSIVSGPGYGTSFSLNGEYPSYIQGTALLSLGDDELSFLNNAKQLERALLEKGETVVHDIKIFVGMLPVMYIRGENKEYLIRLRAAGLTFNQIETLKIYEAAEFTQLITSILSTPDGGSAAGRRFAQRISLEKPTYEAEGAALMADGIISGNEKGLDPLKPLNRLEAITILVRALGLENQPTQETSEFVDITDDNWGVKYANIAKDKGITQGIGDNKFAPDALVTDKQFAAMLLRTTEAETFDWEQAINMLIEKEIITAEQAETMDLFTRGDMAKIIYEARAKGLLN